MALAAMAGCSKSPSAPRLGTGGPLIPVTVYNDSPVWSPDGVSFAFIHLARDVNELARGQYQVWTYDLQTMNARFVASGLDPSWSPDGENLLFLSGGQVMAFGVSSGTVSSFLTLGDISDVSWSPVEPLLAVATDYMEVTGATHIWLVPLTGGPPRKVIGTDVEGSWLQPRFSPDGGRILHERFLLNTTGTELFTMDTSGASTARLTSNEQYDFGGAWSPDGSKIAYSSGPDVWIMNFNGTGKHRVLAAAKEPCWSPDGRKLLVTRVNVSTSLWTVSPDGSNATPIPGLP